MNEEEPQAVDMKPFSGLVMRTAKGRQLTIEEAVERYIALTWQEIHKDLLYYRQPQSMHEVTKLPPAAIAGLTHKIESQGLVAIELSDPVSERQWVIAKNPHYQGWVRSKKNRKNVQHSAELIMQESGWISA